MLNLDLFNGIFNKSRAEVLRVIKEVESYVKPKDRAVAATLGMAYPEKVYMIRIILEAYDLLIEKQKEGSVEIREKKLIIKEDRITEQGLDYTQEEGNSIEEETVEEEIQDEAWENIAERSKVSKEKAILIYTECGTHDYGTKALKDQVEEISKITEGREETETTGSQSSRSDSRKLGTEDTDRRDTEEQRDKILSTEENRKSRRMEGLDDSIHATKNYKEPTDQREKEIRSSRETRITLWDLPTWYRSEHIRKITKHLGWTRRINFFNSGQNRGAVVDIETENEEQRRKTMHTWAIGLENGKLTRVTLGERDYTTLKERRKNCLTLTGISAAASEVLILRATRNLGAKAVYIPYNRNQNQRKIAWVYFENQEDKRTAARRHVNYQNVNLQWRKDWSSEEKELSTDKIIQERLESKTKPNRKDNLRDEKENRHKANSDGKRGDSRDRGKKKEVTNSKVTDERNIYGNYRENTENEILYGILRRLESLEERLTQNNRGRGGRTPSRS